MSASTKPYLRFVVLLKHYYKNNKFFQSTFHCLRQLANSNVKATLLLHLKFCSNFLLNKTQLKANKTVLVQHTLLAVLCLLQHNNFDLK